MGHSESQKLFFVFIQIWGNIETSNFDDPTQLV